MPTYKIRERRREIWNRLIYIDADSEEEAREIWESGDYEPDPFPEHQYDVDARIDSIEEE